MMFDDIKTKLVELNIEDVKTLRNALEYYIRESSCIKHNNIHDMSNLSVMFNDLSKACLLYIRFDRILNSKYIDLKEGLNMDESKTLENK